MVDLYWGVDPEEWDSPELQRLRMKLLEECLKTSAGPCFVVSVGTGTLVRVHEMSRTPRRAKNISVGRVESVGGGG